jgi:transcriptional regulator with XRE-family HTH domain
LGITQAQLATQIRVNRHHPTPSYVSRLEHGRLDPRLSTIRSIARALKVKPWQLLADLSDNVEFWRGYLDLSPGDKREVQRLIRWMLDKRERR